MRSLGTCCTLRLLSAGQLPLFALSQLRDPSEGGRKICVKFVEFMQIITVGTLWPGRIGDLRHERCVFGPHLRTYRPIPSYGDALLDPELVLPVVQVLSLVVGVQEVVKVGLVHVWIDQVERS